MIAARLLLFILMMLAAAHAGSAIAQSGGTKKALSETALIASPEDLKDKRIAVLLGSAQASEATQRWPGATVLQFGSPTDMVLAIKTGKADAALSDGQPLKDILRQDPSLAILPQPLHRIPVGVGFNKENPALLTAFNAFLASIKRDGTYADMIDRWIEKGVYNMPELGPQPSGQVLTVGVSDGGMPFGGVVNNRWVGFDIEMAQRFANSQGKSLKIVSLEFGSLIAALVTGKVDLIAASIFITDERKQRINFSDPYFEETTVLLALRTRLPVQASTEGPTAGSGNWLARIKSSVRDNLLTENRYLLIWDGLKTTVLISILATALGTLLGALTCWMRMSKRGLLRLPAIGFISLLRGIPVLVLLLILYYVVFASVDINPVLVSVIAFALNFAAYSAEIFRAGIQGLDRGQAEAGIAMGFGRLRTFWYITLPQTIQRVLPVYKGEFISLVKMTSIVGYIAVQDLTKASDIIRSRTFDAFFPLLLAAALYFLIAWALLQAINLLERRTDPHLRRQRGRIA